MTVHGCLPHLQRIQLAGTHLNGAEKEYRPRESRFIRSPTWVSMGQFVERTDLLVGEVSASMNSFINPKT